MRIGQQGWYGVLRGFSILVAAIFVSGSSCSLQHAYYPYPLHFRAAPDPSVGEPPAEGLLLWLEGDRSTLATNSAGAVVSWRDQRGNGRALVPLFGSTGRLVTATLRASGGDRPVFGLSCGDSTFRCAYEVTDPGVRRSLTLDDTPYTIVAVVRRANDRRDNYFIMSAGQGCQTWAGGTGCTPGSVLHVGWLSGDSLRHGHYDNDVDITHYNEPNLLFSVMSGPSGMDITALGRPTFQAGYSRTSPGPLRHSGSVLVGGAPFGADFDYPNWHFEGTIFALLVYSRELGPAERRQAEDYLRNGYGPS